jgi:hypothetical protein
MAQSDCDAIGMNFIADLLECSQEEKGVQLSQQFIDSPWYADIIHVLENLQAPPGASKTKARYLKLKVVKFCILETHSTRKNDPGGYRWPPTFSDWLKTVFWQFWQFTIFSRF